LVGKDVAIAFAEYGKLVSGQWSGHNLGDVIDRYRTEVLPLKRSTKTRTDQAKQLEKLKAVFGAVPADRLTAQHCYRYLDARVCHPRAARHEISLLGHVFAKAIRWGAATVNPVRTLERSPKGKSTRYITDAAYAAVYALANDRMRIAMDLALLTGQRRGDLLTLKRAQLTDDGIVFHHSRPAPEYWLSGPTSCAGSPTEPKRSSRKCPVNICSGNAWPGVHGLWILRDTAALA